MGSVTKCCLRADIDEHIDPNYIWKGLDYIDLKKGKKRKKGASKCLKKNPLIRKKIMLPRIIELDSANEEDNFQQLYITEESALSN